MATAASGNSGVGTIKVVTGDVKVIGVDGVARQAQVGDKVFAKETIQTNANAIVQVQLEDGRMLDLGRDSKISLDNDVLGTQGPSTTTQTPATGDIAALQAQIAAGADPSKVAEATAAGGAPGAGGAGDGSGGTPVIVDQANSQGAVTSGFVTGPAGISFPDIQGNQIINRPPIVVSIRGGVNVSEEGLEGGLTDNTGNHDTTNSIVYTGKMDISDPEGQPLDVDLGIPAATLFSHGDQIIWELQNDNNTLIGKVIHTIEGGEGSPSTTEEDIVIRVTIDDVGNFQVEVLGQIDHPAVGEEDDLDFDIPVTATDPFGLTGSGVLNVNIEDDSPTIIVEGGEGNVSLPTDNEIAFVSYPQQPTVSADEDDTYNGNHDSAGGDDNPWWQYSVSLPIRFGADGPAAVDPVVLGTAGIVDQNGHALTSGGQELHYEWNTTNDTLIGYIDGEGGHTEIFHLVVDGVWSSGAQVHIELLGPLDHPQASGPEGGEGSYNLPEDNLEFNVTYTATDFDGDSVQGTMVVNVDDDSPRIADGGEGNYSSPTSLTVTVDEDDIDTNWSQGTSPNDGNGDGSTTTGSGAAFASGSLAGLVEFGADGAGGFGFGPNAISYMQSLHLYSKQTALPENGLELTYSTSTSGNWAILTASEPDTAGFGNTGNQVFELRVNTETGAFEFRLYDELIHVAPEGGSDQNFELRSGDGGEGGQDYINSINFGAIIRAYDGDGDWVTLDRVFNVQVRDDVPEVRVEVRRNENGVLHDETPGNQDDDTSSSSVRHRFDSVTNRGDDPDVSDSGAIGYAAAGHAVVTTSGTEIGADSPALNASFSLKVLSAYSGLQTTDGQNIYLYEENGLIVGRVGGSSSESHPAAFAISVDGRDGEIYVAQYLSIKHPNTGSSDEEVHINNGAIAIQYSVTDSDGDTVTDQVVMGDLVRFDDDGPSVSSNNTVVVEDDDLPNGIPGGTGDDDAPRNTSGTLDHDYGSDGAGSLLLTGASVPSGQGFSTALSDGGKTLTISQNGNAVLKIALSDDTHGNYTVTQLAPIQHPNGNNENNVNFTLTYRVTDGDGDRDDGSMQISVDDDSPIVTSNSLVLLDDDALAGGNPNGTGDDPNLVNVTGTLGHSFGADGAGSVAYLTSGAPAGFSYVASGSDLLVKQGSVTVMTLTVNSTTGAYTVIQNAPIQHSSGNNENNQPFAITYRVTDKDGDSVNGTLNINVDDDSPVIDVNASAPTVTLEVDETNLLVNDTESFASQFSSSYGADGAGSLNYGLSISSTGVNSGLVDMATGNNIQLYLVGGEVLGRVGGPAGDVAFKVSVDGSGNVTLDQQRAIQHTPDTGPDQPISIVNSSLIKLTATITDRDNDSDSETINIANKLVFRDDEPVKPEDVQRQIAEGGGSTDTNIMLILDVSGSMVGTGLATLKSSVIALLDKYDDMGAVKVRIVTFSDNGNEQGGGWLDIVAAKAIVNGLSANGGTNFDDALLDAMSAFGSAGRMSGAQNVSYFLSDGNPTFSNLVSNNDNDGSAFNPNLGDGIGANGAGSEVSEQEWKDFLNLNGIKSYALGMGTGVTLSNLEPVSYDGIMHSELPATPVDDIGDLQSVLLATVSGNTVTGNLSDEGVLSGVFGADGPGTPQFFSIVHDGVTYLASAGNVLTIASTDAGGKFEFNFTTGAYKYTAPANVNDDAPEVFKYTIVDADGDMNSANLTITVLDGVPVAVADTYAADESFLVQAANVTEGMSITTPASWTLDAASVFDSSLNINNADSSDSATSNDFTLTSSDVDGSHTASVSFTVALGNWNSADRWSATLFREVNGPDTAVASLTNQSGAGTFSFTGIAQPGTYNVVFTANDNSSPSSSSNRADLFVTDLSYTAWTFTAAHTDTYNATAPDVSWSVVPVIGNVLTNDTAEADGVKVVTDVNGNAVAGATSIDGVYGTLVINPDGSFTYTPDSTDFAATPPKVDTFNYTMRDGSSPADTSPATLTFNLADHTYNASTSGNNTFLGGNDGNNSINGDSSNEVVYGGAGNDILNSDGGNDRVMGGVGNDTLIGGGGNDILVGGAGADTFKWGSGDISGGGVEVDVVMDFTENAGDKLDLTDLLSGEHANAGSLTSYLSFSSNGTDTLLSVKDTGSGSVDQQIVLKGVDLTAGGTHNDSQIITDLLAAGKLITSA